MLHDAAGKLLSGRHLFFIASSTLTVEYLSSDCTFIVIPVMIILILVLCQAAIRLFLTAVLSIIYFYQIVALCYVVFCVYEPCSDVL